MFSKQETLDAFFFLQWMNYPQFLIHEYFVGLKHTVTSDCWEITRNTITEIHSLLPSTHTHWPSIAIQLHSSVTLECSFRQKKKKKITEEKKQTEEEQKEEEQKEEVHTKATPRALNDNAHIVTSLPGRPAETNQHQMLERGKPQ